MGRLDKGGLTACGLIYDRIYISNLSCIPAYTVNTYFECMHELSCTLRPNKLNSQFIVTTSQISMRERGHYSLLIFGCYWIVKLMNTGC